MAAVQVDEVLLKLRIELSKKGANVMASLQRAFQHNAENGLVSYAEFEQVLARVGLFLPLPQLTLLARTYDTNHDRTIHVESFMSDLAGKLNDNRAKVVESLFRSFPSSQDGYVKVSEVLSRFKPEYHPKVQSGDKTPSEIKSAFIDLLQSFQEGGQLTWDQFRALFVFLSASIPLNDSYFATEIEHTLNPILSTAHSGEGSEEFVDSSYLASVEQVLKEKIRQKTRGQESEAYTLIRVFRHFDLEDSGTVDFGEWSRALERFGILMPEKESVALFNQHDDDKKGRISYGVFVESLYGTV